jgi:hypothetical protein
MSRLEDPLPERQSYLDDFKGEPLNSDINERRGSTDSRASSNVFFLYSSGIFCFQIKNIFIVLIV